MLHGSSSLRPWPELTINGAALKPGYLIINVRQLREHRLKLVRGQSRQASRSSDLALQAVSFRLQAIKFGLKLRLRLRDMQTDLLSKARAVKRGQLRVGTGETTE